MQDPRNGTSNISSENFHSGLFQNGCKLSYSPGIIVKFAFFVKKTGENTPVKSINSELILKSFEDRKRHSCGLNKY